MTFSNFNTIAASNPLNTAVATPVFTVFATRDPTTSDNAYQPATEWQNQTTKQFWKLASTGVSANWIPLSGGVVPAALTLTGNAGGAVSPSGLGNINVVGDGTTITITGNPGANTLTASLVGQPNLPAIQRVFIDAATAPGTNPVVAINGGITIVGASPIAGTNPVRTNSLAANSFQIQVQRSQAVASTDATTIGLSNFRNTQFSVTTDGFVSLLGGTGPSIKTVNIQVIPTTGTYTPTANMQYCIIEVLGGGGGGGGNEVTAPGNSYAVGSGGGSGEYARGVFTAASIGISQAVTIGAGGAGNSGLAGSNGGTTSVGALITAFGGTGGATSGAAATTFNVAVSGIGGTGGAGGQLRTAGSVGTPGVIVIDAGGVGFLHGGSGGNSQYGAGGNYIYGNAVGNIGLGYGSGGSGSVASGGTGALAGGAGAPGVVVVTEFIS